MWRTVSMAFLAFSMQSSCVGNDGMVDRSADCTIRGAEYLAGSGSKTQMCDDFRARIAAVLNEAGMQGRADDIAMAIEVQKGRSLTARVSQTGVDTGTDFPVVAIDVMDRPLRSSDLDRLADAVGRMLINLN